MTFDAFAKRFKLKAGTPEYTAAENAWRFAYEQGKSDATDALRDALRDALGERHE